MGEILYVERFVYATIIPFKDYCKLSQKYNDFNIINTDKIVDDEDGLLCNKDGGILVAPKPKNAYLLKLPVKNPNKKTKYFYTNDKDKTISLEYFLSDQSMFFYTNKDKQIKRHYGRPFSSITIHILERSIKKVGDKLIVKIYEGTKSRGVNQKYFKKRFINNTLSIDIVKGNFITGRIQKNVKNFRKNSFSELNNIFLNTNIFSLSKENHFINKKNKLYQEYLTNFDDFKFFKCFMNNLNFDFISDHKFKNFNSNFIEFFIDRKKIKVPNGDYDFWLRNFYPTEKYLKRNDRKLFASILDMYGLKSKITIKILHKYPNIDFESFVILCKLFGDDFSLYISNINSLVFENSKKENTHIQSKSLLLQQLQKNFNLSQKDKETLLKYLNNIIKFDRNILTSNRTQLIVDHFVMINKIRVYDPSLHMKATNEKEFKDEHTELSKLVTAIKKGWVVEYQFNQKMLDEIEKPIKSYCICENVPHEKDFIFLYPKVLKREEEYVEEGNFMHHCVATYADQEKSIIISLRNEDQSDRITCEYKIQDGRLIQSRHFCNGSVPEHFKDALEVLSDKVLIHARWGTLNWLEKKNVPIKINGVEIKKTEPTRYEDLFFDLGI